LVKVKGRDLIARQFVGLRICSGDFKVLESHWYGPNEKSAIREAKMQFDMMKWNGKALVQIPLRVISHIEWNDHGEIVHHSDQWSISDWIDSIPLVSYLYNLSRSTVGAITGTAVEYLRG
jgi:hypothetical protein